MTSSEHDDLSLLCRWLGDQGGDAQVVLVCAHETGPVRVGGDAFVVRLDGCAFELSPASYLELVAAGAAAVAVFGSQCPRGDEVAENLAVANRLLRPCPGACVVMEGPGRESWRRRASVHNLRGLPLSRRRLLFLGHLGRAWVPEVHLDQRSRVVAALRQLCSEALDTPLAGLPAPSAALEAVSCNACGVCVRACSTGALSLQEPEGTASLSSSLSSLEYTPARCDDCGRCLTLCPTGALARTGQNDWAGLLEEKAQTLATVPVRRCGRCGDKLAGVDAGGYCPPCAFRLANPFGSAAAPRNGPSIGLLAPDLGRDREPVASTF